MATSQIRFKPVNGKVLAALASVLCSVALTVELTSLLGVACTSPGFGSGAGFASCEGFASCSGLASLLEEVVALSVAVDTLGVAL
jgi:hypothetical protein